MISRRKWIFIAGVSMMFASIPWLPTWLHNHRKLVLTSRNPSGPPIAGGSHFLALDRNERSTPAQLESLLRSGHKVSDELLEWAEQEPDAAIAWTKEHHPELLWLLVPVWVRHDLEDAVAWNRKLKSARSDGDDPFAPGAPFDEGLLDAIADTNPARALKYIAEDLRGQVSSSWRTLLPDSARNADDCREMLVYLSENAERFSFPADYLERPILEKWKEIDLTGALAWQDREGSPMDILEIESPVTTAYKLGLSQNPGEIGEVLILDQETDRDRRDVMRTLIESWSAKDPISAAVWLQKQPEEPHTFQARIEGAVALMTHDPDAAFALLDPIPDGQMLERAIERLFTSFGSRDREAAVSFLEAQRSHWPAQRWLRLREAVAVAIN